jgi:CelD/BcsL family acetyltransferase involved in cellulose biosynthesis
VTTRLVPLRLLSPADVDAWRELARRSVEANPFFEPELVLPAARHLGGREVGLLIAGNGNGWSACLPVRTGRLGGVVKSLGSWRHPYCFLGTPLVDPDRLEEGVEGLIEHALRRERRPLLAFDRMSEGPALQVMRDLAAERGLDIVFQHPIARAALQRRPEATYFDDVRPHHRREMKRLGRRLQDGLGAPLTVEERAGQADAVESFLGLEASGWKGQARTAMASVGAHADFFRSVCRAFAEQGRLQLLSLEAEGRRVAMKCNLAAGQGIFCFKIGHDSELRRFSPGVQLERANVEVFHEQRGERFMDSCADPDNDMINRLWPDRCTVTSVVLSRPGARSMVARRGLPAVHALRTRDRRKSSSRS